MDSDKAVVVRASYVLGFVLQCIIVLCVPLMLFGCQGPSAEDITNYAPHESEDQQAEQNSTDPATPGDTTLPGLSSIDPAMQPLLYDFVAGCLDWHTSIHRDTIDSDLYLLRNLQTPEVIYTDWYAIQGGFTVPPTGTIVESITLHKRDVTRFDTIAAGIPEEYKVQDGDWQLIIYAGEAAKALNQLDIVFRDTFEWQDSRLPPFLEDGTGWPTEWLRREPYATRLATESEIDMQDQWWDTFRLEGKYQLTPSAKQGDLHTYHAICTGVMQFSFCDDEGNTARGMSWDLLRETCNAMHSDIPNIYQQGTWSSSEE